MQSNFKVIRSTTSQSQKRKQINIDENFMNDYIQTNNQNINTVTNINNTNQRAHSPTSEEQITNRVIKNYFYDNSLAHMAPRMNNIDWFSKNKTNMKNLENKITNQVIQKPPLINKINQKSSSNLQIQTNMNNSKDMFDPLKIQQYTQKSHHSNMQDTSSVKTGKIPSDYFFDPQKKVRASVEIKNLIMVDPSQQQLQHKESITSNKNCDTNNLSKEKIVSFIQPTQQQNNQPQSVYLQRKLSAGTPLHVQFQSTTGQDSKEVNQFMRNTEEMWTKKLPLDYSFSIKKIYPGKLTAFIQRQEKQITEFRKDLNIKSMKKLGYNQSQKQSEIEKLQKKSNQIQNDSDEIYQDLPKSKLKQSQTYEKIQVQPLTKENYIQYREQLKKQYEEEQSLKKGPRLKYLGTKIIQKQRIQRQQIREAMGKISEASEFEKLKFYVNDIIQEGTVNIKDFIYNDPKMNEYLSEICLMSREEFYFLITSYFRYCIDQLIEVLKPSQFTSRVKVQKQPYMDNLKDIYVKAFQKFNQSTLIQTHFIKTWDTNYYEYFEPKNMVEEIGGFPRLKKLMGLIFNIIADDLGISKSKPVYLTLTSCVSNLLNEDQQYFLQDFHEFLQGKHITPNEFFLLKRSVNDVIQNAIMPRYYKYFILEKIESIRILIFPFVYSKNLKKELSLKLYKIPQFTNYFDNSETTPFISNLLMYFYNNKPFQEFIEQIKKTLVFQLNDKFFQIAEKSLLESMPTSQCEGSVNIKLFLKDIEYKLYKFKSLAQVGYCLNSIYQQVSKTPEEFISELDQFIKTWVIQSNKKPSMQDSKSMDTSFLRFYLSLILQQEHVFSIYDIYWSIPFYAVNLSMFSLWLQAIKVFLIKKNIPEDQTLHFVQTILKFSTLI